MTIELESWEAEECIEALNQSVLLTIESREYILHNKYYKESK